MENGVSWYDTNKSARLLVGTVLNILHSLYKYFSEEPLGLGLGLQDSYSATNCADNILGRFTIIRQIKLQE